MAPSHLEPARRDFLRTITVGTLTALLCRPLWGGEAAPASMSPNEDLMQEHALLNRVQLVYDEVRHRLETRTAFNPALLKSSAEIIQRFVENYHEKNEENYVFPEFEKRGKLVDLVSVLRAQHAAGRKVTQDILALSTTSMLKDPTLRSKLISRLHAFTRMYRPHEAREGSVLYPAFRDLLPAAQFDDLGDKFEKIEHQVLGSEGFEGQVERVAEIEKALGLYELAQYTPHT